jgi:archaellum component FlaC
MSKTTIFDDLHKNSLEIIGEVKKALGEENSEADADAQKKADEAAAAEAAAKVEPDNQEKALGAVNKALESITSFFKKSKEDIKKSDDDDEDDKENGEGAEGEGDDDDDMGKSLAAFDPGSLYSDPDNDMGAIDAGPIFKSIDVNTAEISNRLTKIEKSMAATQKMIEQLAGGISASLVAQKSITSSVGSLMGGISELYKLPIPFRSVPTGRQHLQQGGAQQDVSKGINLNHIMATDPMKYKDYSDAITKAVQDKKISHDEGIAIFDDKIIPAGRVSVIHEIMKQ